MKATWASMATDRTGPGQQAQGGGRHLPPPPPPPPPPRTKWTRRVPHPVLIGHAASLAGCGAQATRAEGTKAARRRARRARVAQVPAERALGSRVAATTSLQTRTSGGALQPSTPRSRGASANRAWLPRCAARTCSVLINVKQLEERCVDWQGGSNGSRRDCAAHAPIGAEPKGHGHASRRRGRKLSGSGRAGRRRRPRRRLR